MGDPLRDLPPAVGAMVDQFEAGLTKELKPGWTQPCCGRCWGCDHGDRVPHRLLEPVLERCVYCGLPTTSGIYVRIDPAVARYPTLS